MVCFILQSYIWVQVLDADTAGRIYLDAHGCMQTRGDSSYVIFSVVKSVWFCACITYLKMAAVGCNPLFIAPITDKIHDLFLESCAEILAKCVRNYFEKATCVACEYGNLSQIHHVNCEHACLKIKSQKFKCDVMKMCPKLTMRRCFMSWLENVQN